MTETPTRAGRRPGESEKNMFRVYYTWRNRGGTTHTDARTLDGAKALMNVKFQLNNNLLMAAIENLDTNERLEFYGPTEEVK